MSKSSIAKPYWTVWKIREALDLLSLTDHGSFVDSIRVLHDHRTLVIMVRGSGNQEPEEITWCASGLNLRK